jgi:hypothetical protein
VTGEGTTIEVVVPDTAIVTFGAPPVPVEAASIRDT